MQLHVQRTCGMLCPALVVVAVSQQTIYLLRIAPHLPEASRKWHAMTQSHAQWLCKALISPIQLAQQGYSCPRPARLVMCSAPEVPCPFPRSGGAKCVLILLR